MREALGIPADAVVSITVGRMDLVKGYQYQIAAMKPLRASPAWPSLRFVWVGDGGLAEQLRGLAARLRIDDKVHLLARRNDVPDLLDAADLFVLPSLFEGMPLAVIEAMAKGLPVVASAVSGTPEALGDAGRVLATPVRNPAFPQALAAAIERLVLDPSERRDLGAAARARAEPCFRASRMGERAVARATRAARLAPGPRESPPPRDAVRRDATTWACARRCAGCAGLSGSVAGTRPASPSPAGRSHSSRPHSPRERRSRCAGSSTA